MADIQTCGEPGQVDRVLALHAGSRGFDSHRGHMSERFFRSNRPGYPHPVSSELENSGRVAVGDCSVTERRRWRPPYQTGRHFHFGLSESFRHPPPLKNYLNVSYMAMALVGRLKWIDSFLCDRQQRVMVNGVKSDWAPVLTGVPQGTVLGPLLFSLYINDITEDIDSELRLFADDCVCYREIKDTEDTVKLQEDIDRLGCWARSWGMRFQPVKCNIMQITSKRIKKINASYSLEGTVLENVEKIKCLGVTITNDLKWNTHVSNICTKANRTLGFLRRNLAAYPRDVKESAYKGLVRQFGTPKVYFSEMNLRRFRKEQLDL